MDEILKQALNIIDKNKFISVKDLTKELGVARGTTDRYLQKLEESRLIKRVQGGAVSLHRDFEFCPHYYFSENDKYFEERVLIAKSAVEMINNRDSIFLGGGLNTLHVARELRQQRKNVNVITNSLHVALLLAETCHVDIVGTMPTNNEGILIGQVDKDIKVNKVFIAPCTVTDDGFYNMTLLIVELESFFIKNAQCVIILADSDVYSASSPYKMCSYSDVDTIITTKNAPSFIKQENAKICYL